MLGDVAMSRFEGMSGEAESISINHSVTVSRTPGASLFAANGDRVRLATWTEPVVTFIPAGTRLFALPTKTFDVSGISMPHHYFDQITAGTAFEQVDYQFFRTTSDQMMIYAAKLLSVMAFSIEPVDDPLLVETLVSRLVCRIVTHLSALKRRADEVPVASMSAAKLALVATYIDANLHRVIRLQELARVAGMSLYHFSRSYRSTTSSTPMHFVSARRVDRAKDMLRTPAALADVAFACGFSSQSHFTTVFRELTGMTPAKYRATLQAA